MTCMSTWFVSRPLKVIWLQRIGPRVTLKIVISSSSVPLNCSRQVLELLVCPERFWCDETHNSNDTLMSIPFVNIINGQFVVHWHWKAALSPWVAPAEEQVWCFTMHYLMDPSGCLHVHINFLFYTKPLVRVYIITLLNTVNNTNKKTKSNQHYESFTILI